MKVSKKTEYGLRFLLALAELGEGKFMGIYQISLRHKIPMKFLEAIAVQLKKFGMLEVKKGAGGGYKLKYRPERISLLMVFECLEDATRKDYELDGDISSNQKAVSLVLNNVIGDVRDVLEAKTLSDIQGEYRNLNESLMYYI
ncbi:RrF2 family transcriptional regulator [Saccharicrinis aurantiacus]|uniref:RrF2 family transcriptional regulator n=1 Tax=Saccharicrinis aurantiacus TaxID=1849719 RepID=UPI0009502EB4|nr:Rrf2 family transcriptional regulator [Saccharicrinis aurantiacus]